MTTPRQPEAVTVNLHVRPDTVARTTVHDAGGHTVGTTLGDWPAAVCLLGFREDVERVLRAALASLPQDEALHDAGRVA